MSTPSPAGTKRLADRALTICWIAMIVLTGTYLRGREAYATDADWLVLLRLGVFGLGALLGLRLLRRDFLRGPGARAIVAYLAVMLASCITSPSHRIVLGYWLLTAGSALVTLCAVHRRSREAGLTGLERVWLVTMLIILVKDSLSSLSYRATVDSLEAQRLGRDITSPAFMSLYATLAFWLLPALSAPAARAWRIAGRVFLAYVVIAARTRMLILNFFATAALRLGLVRRRNAAQWLLLGCAAALILIAGLVLGDPGQGWMGSLLSWFNRGLDSEAVRTLTGRLDVWTSAVRLTSQSLRTTLLGHGYGVTRYYLNWQDGSPEFYASHCHNAFIEHYFAAGLPGLAVFVVMIAVALRWVLRTHELAPRFAGGFALRAASVVLTILFVSLTEVPVGGGRVNPAMLLFFFYLAALDRAAEAPPA